MAFVVMVSRNGKQEADSLVCVLDTLVKKNAIKVAEDEYRKQLRLASSVSIRSTILFEESLPICQIFHQKLLEKTKA